MAIVATKEYHDCKISISDNRVIGFGSTSVVYKGIEVPQGLEKRRKVAVKAIDLERIPIECVVKEVHTQQTIRHPNIVPILYCGMGADKSSPESKRKTREEELWLVMPLYLHSGASLIKKYPDGLAPIGFGYIATILHDILSALKYMHDNSIIHRDIKGGNILIDEGKVALSDFGVSAILLRDINNRVVTRRKTFTGSLAWIAPEVARAISDEPYGDSADIWSLGMTAMELAFGKPPYLNYHPMKIMIALMQEDSPEYPKVYAGVNIPKCFASFVRKCLRKDVKKRYTATQLLEHKFFKKYYKAGSTLKDIV